MQARKQQHPTPFAGESQDAAPGAPVRRNPSGRRGPRGGHPSGRSPHAQRGVRPLPTPEELENFRDGWKSVDPGRDETTDPYFYSYGHYGIHEDMLRDQVRTGSYHRAIMQNQHLFANKIVLDVGSGTGILSFFAAKAGAKHVYGIECSDIVHTSREIASSNGMGDRVTFIQGRVEEITLPVEHVDIIVSEWMGYFLLYESMLDTVIFARDKWLQSGGLLFPDRAALYVAGIEDAEYKQEKIGFWNNVYGMDFSVVEKSVMEEPIIDVVETAAVATDAYCVLDLNLQTCTKESLDFVAAFRLNFVRKDFVHALVFWFDVMFSACHKPISFTTGPAGRFTHWRQTVFYLQDVLVGNRSDEVSGMIAVKKNDGNHRELDVKLACSFRGDVPVESTQYFRIR